MKSPIRLFFAIAGLSVIVMPQAFDLAHAAEPQASKSKYRKPVQGASDYLLELDGVRSKEPASTERSKPVENTPNADKLGNFEIQGIKSPRDAASGQATGIVSPRDTQSGLPTGN